MMRFAQNTRPLPYLLGWFIRLRWVAGAAVLAGASVEWRWLGWFGHPGAIAGIGATVLFYNAVLWTIMRRTPQMDRNRGVMLAHAWAQLLLDLGCLTLLVLLTGGSGSPLLGFFVFHMVFASLLLPRQMAYAGAGFAMAMLAVGLWLSNQWPADRHNGSVMLGWAATMLMTVWLANVMTRSLRRQRTRLVRQNRRIRAMSSKLRRQQQGMIQQEKMAAAGRMAAGVAHEIANPLASMDGLLQLMERRPERTRPDAVVTLRGQVARINQIVRRMTEFAHPGDGQWQAAALNELVDRALEMLRFDPRIKRVEIERHFAADMPRVKILADSVQQIIINLVINALDAMEQTANPRLVLRTQHSGEWCSLEVQDNGCGIGSEQIRRIFEPFYTTKPVGKGTGLGLSISYSLVRKLGGQIRVESHKGEGARFVIRLPVEDRPAIPQTGTGARQHCGK